MAMKSWLLKSNLILYMMTVFVLISIMIFILNNKNYFLLLEINLMKFSSLCIPVIFLFDQWSLMFFSTVVFISYSVFLFSKSYMNLDLNYSRFHLILLMFVFSMWMLIFSPGFFSLMLGWDGLGLSSFLLVIYYKNYKSLNAGMLTFMTNRLGDGFMLTGMFFSVLVMSFNSFVAETKLCVTMVFYLLVLGSLTKSAQIPFSAWLPAAMAAPTPVSSLVHSSTLVTAGVYVIFRISDFLDESILLVLVVLGTLTMLMASISALTETDMKKIVALSTLSQLGLMILALGSSQPELGFFHLITHAFFKALMFVGVGVIMHSSKSYQNLKIMGYSYSTPVVLGIISGANFSLCGLPFFSGFFSKEMIIQSSSLMANCSLILSILFLLSIILTQMYSIRFIAKVFILSKNFMPEKNFSEADKQSLYAMMILFIPACLTGSFLSATLKIFPDFFYDPSFMKLVISSVFIVSLILTMWMMKKKILLPHYSFMFNMWLLPHFSGMLFSKAFFFTDKNYMIFMNSLVENMTLYSFKLMGDKALKVTNYKSDKIMKLSVMILIFVLIMAI